MAVERLQVRRDTAAAWTANNPVLADGEPGMEKPSGKVKYGDGVTPWTSLPYASEGPAGAAGPPGPVGLAEDPNYTGLYLTSISLSPDPTYPGLYTF